MRIKIFGFLAFWIFGITSIMAQKGQRIDVSHEKSSAQNMMIVTDQDSFQQYRDSEFLSDSMYLVFRSELVDSLNNIDVYDDTEIRDSIAVHLIRIINLEDSIDSHRSEIDVLFDSVYNYGTDLSVAFDSIYFFSTEILRLHDSISAHRVELDAIPDFTGWDTDVSDDFSGDYNDLSNKAWQLNGSVLSPLNTNNKVAIGATSTTDKLYVVDGDGNLKFSDGIYSLHRSTRPNFRISDNNGTFEIDYFNNNVVYNSPEGNNLNHFWRNGANQNIAGVLGSGQFRVYKDLSLQAKLLDNGGEEGVVGQVLGSTGTGVEWQNFDYDQLGNRRWLRNGNVLYPIFGSDRIHLGGSTGTRRLNVNGDVLFDDGNGELVFEDGYLILQRSTFPNFRISDNNGTYEIEYFNSNVIYNSPEGNNLKHYWRNGAGQNVFFIRSDNNTISSQVSHSFSDRAGTPNKGAYFTTGGKLIEGELMSNTGQHDFYQDLTTNPPTSITQDIYRTGGALTLGNNFNLGAQRFNLSINSSATTPIVRAENIGSGDITWHIDEAGGTSSDWVWGKRGSTDNFIIGSGSTLGEDEVIEIDNSNNQTDFNYDVQFNEQMIDASGNEFGDDEHGHVFSQSASGVLAVPVNQAEPDALVNYNITTGPSFILRATAKRIVTYTSNTSSSEVWYENELTGANPYDAIICTVCNMGTGTLTINRSTTNNDDTFYEGGTAKTSVTISARTCKEFVETSRDNWIVR